MPPKRWDMGGLRCIVTGGSKGLGRACVEEFLELGAFVLFTARGADELARVATELRGQYNDDDEREDEQAQQQSSASIAAAGRPEHLRVVCSSAVSAGFEGRKMATCMATDKKPESRSLPVIW